MIDDIVLRTPGDVSRDIALRARLNWVGRSSMEVGIRVEQPGGEATLAHVASRHARLKTRRAEAGRESR